ncbi:XrtA/PEP-CTERM system amidotransferase [Aquisalimonas asiatica]|uniref:asparagine synthase (glutamine-hydrolyzing) n=1 Tax=Aquisalimonas asiatica TaxID=406100 RepID=A0A1H8U3G9_9GAMM|nr:XrtA/PEP-CTERM system amidotransferase [Aquisalimonas asiatica]SEO97820.1 asparagine synthase (glutamine-hydrolysing) [Aquisalimonas asiatica]
MCGLVGCMDTRGRRDPDEVLLRQMNAAQFHRGPDQGGEHFEPGLALGHRRLSIIDLASGQQPLANEDGSVVVVYNGEIYNFPALMDELVARGHQFRTRCDTEVIVHAWEEWGEACVERFRGMFAFALWDRNAETLFLARDRLGIKPLHYAELSDGRLLFGSELKALLACADLPRVLDPEAVEDYFAFGYVPDPRTIFTGASKLPPGHTLTVRRGAPVPAPVPYWDVVFGNDGPADLEVATGEFVERFSEAVRIRMVAEVPLGAFLSGGVDSSAVVAMMSGLSEDPVNTCSIGFGDPRYNESAYAEAVAARYHTRHFSEQVDPDRFDLLDQLALMHDEPFADSSALPTYEVSRIARSRVTVALSGDGGDEMLGGYRRYRGYVREENLRRMLPDGVRRGMFGPLARVYPKADWAPRPLRAKATLEALAADAVDGYMRSVGIIDDASRRRLFSPEFRGRLGAYRASEVLRRHAAKASPDDPLAFVQYLDLKTWLAGGILTKVDRASMANALEVRVPLLDHKLVEWMARLPAHHKIRGQQGKYLFKHAMEPHLPSDILYRPKQGFNMPIGEWFRGPLRERLPAAVCSERMLDTGFFNPAELKRLVAEHQSGRRNHTRPLWSLLMFESFLRQRAEGADTRPDEGRPLARGVGA